MTSASTIVAILDKTQSPTFEHNHKLCLCMFVMPNEARRYHTTGHQSHNLPSTILPRLHHPPPSPNSHRMYLSSACVSLSLVTVVSLSISGFIVGNVIAQQSGHLPDDKSNASSVIPTTTTSSASASSNNNYAASISLLTAGNNNNERSGYLHYPRDKLFSLSDSLYSGYGSEALKNLEKPSPAYYNYNKNSIPASDSYYSRLYSPYMMPVSNYYTGSSSVSSAASSPVSSLASPISTSTGSSPYHYTHYHQSQTKTGSSLKDKLLKASGSSRINATLASPKETAEQEKLNKQMQMAVIYQQLMAMQQYRSLYGGQGMGAAGGVGAAGGAGYGYPNYAYLSALYQLYNQPEAAGSTSEGLSSSEADGSSSSGSSSSASETSATTATGKAALSEAAQLQLQQLAASLAYRQHLASHYGGGGGAGLYGSPSAGGAGLYGSPAAGGGFGGSSLYGGYGGGYGGLGSLGGAGGGYGAYSSLYGSAMPTGTGSILSSLTNGFTSGLQSLTGGHNHGGGLGVLNTLGMLFG